MVTYSCDFETTADIDDCRVWAWVAIDIDNTDKKYLGNALYEPEGRFTVFPY